ncbi:MAG: DUF4290 domain-containing protein [Microscillaceae bacterium]|nr:DUF4290 domain-containing protein [Microscillaceae bacterium]
MNIVNFPPKSIFNLDEYNTQKPFLILKEYGRNIQKIVEYIVKIEEREERTRYAHNLIELMRQINPNTRDSQDYQNKLWDDLYIMSGFSLDVESPYPMPKIEELGKKPQRLDYNSHKIVYKHYGKNIELLIQKAFELEDEEEKFSALIHIGRLMKSFFLSWNKDNIQDVTILDHIEKISNIKLGDELREKILAENPFELAIPREKKAPASNGNTNSSSSSGSNNNINKKPKRKKK